MDWQCLGKSWMRNDSANLEEDFRESLKKLEAVGATNSEIADAVIESPYILGLIWVVTSSGNTKNLKTRYGRPPEGWDSMVNRQDLRDDWRAETVDLLRRKCERDGMLGCKLDAPRIGGFWRLVINDKAVKAAETLSRKNICKLRKGKTACDVSRVSDQDGIANPRSERLRESLIDFRIDSAMATDGVEDLREQAAKRLKLLGNDYQEVARLLTFDLHLDFLLLIHELKNPREREVVRLSLLGHSYRSIERILTERWSEDEKKVTFGMVQYAYEKGVASLQARLGLAA